MTDQPDTTRDPPQALVEALDRAEADVAAGRVSDGVAVRQRLRDSIKRMQAGTTTRAADRD